MKAMKSGEMAHVIYHELDILFTQVGTDVKLMSMVKAMNTEAPIWYAQVNINLHFNHNKLFSSAS